MNANFSTLNPKQERINYLFSCLQKARKRQLKSEKYLLFFFEIFSLERIKKRKAIMRKRFKKIKKICKKLKRLGVVIDLEQRETI
ncbi:hypothetical protein [Aliarcobacter butzleri]|uniref:hypothetical protein n=1 Tax=Aliarcobacter butzleri TaxID=28197 RepID=UPI001269C06C|nr:hypothetical protein [Aliarcobacter butzleri]